MKTIKQKTLSDRIIFFQTDGNESAIMTEDVKNAVLELKEAIKPLDDKRVIGVIDEIFGLKLAGVENEK